jgi:hypothetical protein
VAGISKPHLTLALDCSARPSKALPALLSDYLGRAERLI